MENIFDVIATLFARKKTDFDRNQKCLGKKPLFLFYLCVAHEVFSQLMCNVGFSFSSWLVISNCYFEKFKIKDIAIATTDEPKSPL